MPLPEDPRILQTAPTRAPEAPPPFDDHRDGNGGFRNPWPRAADPERSRGGFLRWRFDRLTSSLPPDPAPGDIPRGTPHPAAPRSAPGELRVTWVGHATFLLQLDGLNLLTDPVFGERASPVSWAGPARFSPPGVRIDELPPIDGVLLSHDHYDHLDRASVDALLARFGPELPWYTPLGYERWFAERGARRVAELDWWHEVPLEGASGAWRLVALPVRHWTRRGLRAGTRLWCSWALVPGAPVDGGASGDARSGASGSRGGAGGAAGPGDAERIPRGLYFAGDSGYCPAFADVGRRLGPFRAALMPVGAYEPRWFMAPSHMSPEEAVRAYLDLGGEGAFVGMHWGTFRLTDEDPLEPPERTRSAWKEAILPGERLHLPGIGGTVILDPAGRAVGRDPGSEEPVASGEAGR